MPAKRHKKRKEFELSKNGATGGTKNYTSSNNKEERKISAMQSVPPMMGMALVLFCLVVYVNIGGSHLMNARDHNSSSKLAGHPKVQHILSYSGESLDHDEKSFTQGLSFYNNYLYESTGLHGKSIIKKIDPETGETVAQSENLKRLYFGEGIAILKDKIYQLTWKHQVGFIYDVHTLQRDSGGFRYTTKTGEGWGLTTDGKFLIASDGSDTLYFWDPEDDFREVKKVQVYMPSKSPSTTKPWYINELEYIEGFIYANIWFQDVILRIDPSDGRVAQVFHFPPDIYPKSQRTDSEAVLNGIAYDPARRAVWLTGKLWPQAFRFELA
mmetsp:Transcript_10650/g.17142  ORF Transcript_10650/g.17142 Transcript_10650/m.17142 type:complete len:326 (+) Transcript_10650:75-1052(+)